MSNSRGPLQAIAYGAVAGVIASVVKSPATSALGESTLHLGGEGP